LMNSDSGARFIFLGTQFLSIFACVWFLRCFFGFPKKTIAIKAIAILSTADLLLHFIAGLFFSFPSFFINRAGVFLVNFVVRFSIFCACNIAFQVFKTVAKRSKTESEQQYRWSVLATLILSVIFTLLWQLPVVAIGNETRNLYFAVVPFVMCFTFTLYFYARSLYVIRSYPEEIQGVVKEVVRKLFIYPFIQIISIMPLAVYLCMSTILKFEVSFLLSLIFAIPLSLIGFLNTLIFLVQQHSSQKLEDCGENLGDNSATINISRDLSSPIILDYKLL